jgi:hypothetical protein
MERPAPEPYFFGVRITENNAAYVAMMRKAWLSTKSESGHMTEEDKDDFRIWKELAAENE